MSNKRIIEIFVMDKRNNRRDENSIIISKMLSKIQAKLNMYYKMNITRVNKHNVKTITRRGIKTIPCIKLGNRIYGGLENCMKLLTSIMNSIEEKESSVNTAEDFESYLHRDAMEFKQYCDSNGSSGRGFDGPDDFNQALDDETIKRKLEEQNRMRENMRENMKYNKSNIDIQSQSMKYGQSEEDAIDLEDYFSVDQLDNMANTAFDDRELMLQDMQVGGGLGSFSF